MRNPEGIARALGKADSVCVCCHVNPDGDTLGSALALALALRPLGKRVQVFCPDKVPDNLMFLPGAAEIRPCAPEDGPFDLFLAVDVSDPARLGSSAEMLRRAADSAQIDHHGTNPGYCRINSVDGEASAVSAMIYEQLGRMGLPVTSEIAVCLYTGLSTDTGNFAFDCTNPESFQVMEGLMRVGLPLAELNMRLFREKDPRQLKLLGRALERMTWEAEGRIAVTTLTLRDFAECEALPEHADTLVNYGLESLGTKMALLAREDGDGKVKFSLRARAPLAVDGIARRMGGGGHPRAAGISMAGTLAEKVPLVVEAMKETLTKEMK